MYIIVVEDSKPLAWQRFFIGSCKSPFNCLKWKNVPKKIISHVLNTKNWRDAIKCFVLEKPCRYPEVHGIYKGLRFHSFVLHLLSLVRTFLNVVLN